MVNLRCLGGCNRFFRYHSRKRWLFINSELQRIEQRKSIENRSDDDLNTIVKRYDKYMETTKPVLDFYSKNSNFYELDGSSKIEEITAKINSFLNV